MSVTHDSPAIDKATWGDGPWQTEPDRVEWEHAGLPCLAIRNPHGDWCGYAAVPPGHPAHGLGYEAVSVDVHGGLTYANACRGDICHVPKPGAPDDVWWLGFDCSHCTDYTPGTEARLRSSGWRSDPVYNHAEAVAANDWMVKVYRTIDYVQTETNQLAEQLAAR